jgi:hypothetical protein
MWLFHDVTSWRMSSLQARSASNSSWEALGKGGRALHAEWILLAWARDDFAHVSAARPHVPAALAQSTASSKALPFLILGSSQLMDSGSFRHLKGFAFSWSWNIPMPALTYFWLRLEDHLVLCLNGLVWMHGLPSSSLASSEALMSPEVWRIFHSFIAHSEAPKSLAEDQHLS